MTGRQLIATGKYDIDRDNSGITIKGGERVLYLKCGSKGYKVLAAELDSEKPTGKEIRIIDAFMRQYTAKKR